MAPIRPRRIRLEASSHCQLRCPSCPTTTRAIHPAVGSGFLRLEEFRRLLEDNPDLAEIELSNYGEAFLNPQLLAIMEAAHARGVALSVHNGANLNNVRPEVLEGLVKYRVRRLACSIDGASQETYGRYRVRGNFDRVIDNIRRINAWKQTYGTDLPQLRWQFILFGHNQHELPAARRMAEELGMEFYLKLSWDNRFSPADEQIARAEFGVANREEFRAKHGRDYMQGLCHQLWDDPQINWDGKVLGCCRNFWGDFGGNAFRDGLAESVNSERIAHARQMLLGRAEPRDDVPCTTCSIYIDMRSSGRFLQR